MSGQAVTRQQRCRVYRPVHRCDVAAAAIRRAAKCCVAAATAAAAAANAAQGAECCQPTTLQHGTSFHGHADSCV